MRAALYARVSTSDRGQETENQFAEFTAFCETHRADPLFYREEETGTGRKRRPVFEQMLRDAENRKFSVLVIWALDRLTREGPLKAMITLNRLYLSGVKVKSLREPWLDPDSPLYELMVPILAWIAKQEANRMSERVHAGLARARATGKHIGRPSLMPSRSKIAALRRGGQSWRQVAKAMNVSVNTARRVFQKPSVQK
jgi:DNA invertase Pin-like site-specific DNA recombinase